MDVQAWYLVSECWQGEWGKGGDNDSSWYHEHYYFPALAAKFFPFQYRFTFWCTLVKRGKNKGSQQILLYMAAALPHYQLQWAQNSYNHGSMFTGLVVLLFGGVGLNSH
jgi:hypothetical protein